MEDVQEIAQDYAAFIEPFANGDVSAPEFEKAYLKKYLNDQRLFGDELYQILSGLFFSVEDFCPDESIRDDDDLSEEDLQRDAKETLVKLMRFCLGGHGGPR